MQDASLHSDFNTRTHVPHVLIEGPRCGNHQYTPIDVNGTYTN